MKVHPLLVLALLVIATDCRSGALAQSTSSLIEAGLNETFSVECYALAQNGMVQKSYGLWDMEVQQLQSLELSNVNSNTTEINCHFVWRTNAGNALHQDFDVYLASGLAFSCSDVCHWTVFSDGFYLFNPATSENTFMYPWSTAEDTWVPPV